MDYHYLLQFISAKITSTNYNPGKEKIHTIALTSRVFFLILAFKSLWRKDEVVKTKLYEEYGSL